MSKSSWLRAPMFAAFSWILAVPAMAQFEVVTPSTQRSPIVTEEATQGLGLTRAWVTRLPIDKSHDHIVGTYLDGATLFVLTRQSVLHAVDPRTGQTLWSTLVGRRDAISFGPHANLRYVAVANGGTLYMLDRHTGEPKWEEPLSAAPGASPLVGPRRVYAPLLPGGVVSYDLDIMEDREALRVPQNYPSGGPVELPILLTERSLVWAVSRGFVLAGDPTEFEARFRLELGDAVRSGMAARSPAIFVAAQDQYVYAIHEMSGDVLWRFASGSSHTHPLVVIGDELFVLPDEGGMFCLGAEDGELRWWAPRARQFLAASDARVYAADVLGRTLALSRSTGALRGIMDTRALDWKFMNTATDRIYVGTPDGVINCLHEVELDVPLLHIPPPTPVQLGEPEADEEAEPGVIEARPRTEPRDDFDPGFDDEDDPFRQ